MAYPSDPSNPNAADPLYGYFAACAGTDNQISRKELIRVLTTSGIAGTYNMFSDETARLLIVMLDRDYNGKMGFSEFKEMWSALNQWKNCFMQYDKDRNGNIEPHELQQALISFGYNLSPQALGIILRRYNCDGNSRLSFCDFIGCCISLKAKTQQFQQRDITQQGIATFKYDDFVQVLFA